LQKYYNIRRKLRKCGVLRKESLTHVVEDSVSSGNVNTNLRNIFFFNQFLVYFMF